MEGKWCIFVSMFHIKFVYILCIHIIIYIVLYVCIYIILPVVEDYLDTGQRGHSA